MTTRMAQDDQAQKSSSSGGGGGGRGGGGVAHINRSSKKTKQKKVPQRGLGVAQLEKMILEEQQIKDASASILSCPSSISPTRSSYLSLPIPYLHHSNQSSSTNPFPSLIPSDLPTPVTFIRPSGSSIQSIDVKNSRTVPLANPLNNSKFEACWPSIPVPGHDNVPKLWDSYEFDFEKESCGVDPRLVFRSNISLPFESNPVLPLPCLAQRPQQQYHQPSMSLVNVSSGTSSASVLHYQMEPPSNQNCFRNYATMWPEEKKMVGFKRPYPFSLDNPPPSSSINYKGPAFVASMKLDDTSSCGNGGALSLDDDNLICREGPSCSTISISDQRTKKSSRENDAEFLTLAPPTTSATCPPSNLKKPSKFPAFHNYHEYADFESRPSQEGSVKDPTILESGCGGINQKQPFYSFFPTETKTIYGQTTASITNCSGHEVGECVDLNLKL